MIYHNKTWSYETVIIDNNVFRNCKMIGCDIIFSGGNIDIKDISMEDCTFRFQGAAERTVAWLYRVGGESVIDFIRELIGSSGSSYKHTVN